MFLSRRVAIQYVCTVLFAYSFCQCVFCAAGRLYDHHCNHMLNAYYVIPLYHHLTPLYWHHGIRAHVHLQQPSKTLLRTCTYEKKYCRNMHTIIRFTVFVGLPSGLAVRQVLEVGCASHY